MFGYVKLDKKAPALLKQNFRKHYCFLCRALGKYYGQFSRFLVSFDVTFCLLLFAEDAYLKEIGKIRCFKGSPELTTALTEELAKKIAAFNLTLVAAELDDNIRDKDTFYAKFAYGVLKKQFAKIQNDYPLMWSLINEGYDTMEAIEKANGSLDDMENCFAEIIENVARQCFDVSDAGILSQLKFVAKNLYFMDAVDDLDKDVQRNAFNPLKIYNSKKQLINEHYLALNEHISAQRKALIPPAHTSKNILTTTRIVAFGIPDAFYKICKGKFPL